MSLARDKLSSFIVAATEISRNRLQKLDFPVFEDLHGLIENYSRPSP
ncbi:hypothetical protein [uncultured Hoeflea sp.]|nr:hypothetical protein [uncultured Hoeflea sp.]